jgi:hypothetical protein
MDDAPALAILRRLADAGLVVECRSPAAPLATSGDAMYRVTAKGMAVLLNSVML